MSKASRTRNVARCDSEGKILVPNGHKGRSQKGCFGGTPNYMKERKA